MRRHNLAVGLVGIAVLLAACGKGGGDLPMLPGAQNASANGERSMAAGAADTSMMVANIRYELADGVATDTKSAEAYDFADTNEAAVAKVAKALGVEGEVKSENNAFTVGGQSPDKPTLYVSASGGVFSMSVGYAVSGSSGCAVASPGPDTPVANDQPLCEPAPTTTVPPDAPTAEEAKQVALDTMKAAGVDVSDAKVSVDSFDGANQTVRFRHSVAGETVDGYDSYVAVGPKKAVISASGYLLRPSGVGSYELATLARAVERLNASYGPQPMVARDDTATATGAPADAGTGAPTDTSTEPTIVKLTKVEVGLMMQSDYDGDLWLVPAYRFTSAEGNPVMTAAVADKYIESPPTTKASDTPPPGSGATEPGAPATNCTNFDGDISGQVCATDAKAGEPVTFRVTAADPDRGFASGCFDGVEVNYGDGGPGDVRCEACSTDVPPGPGKLGVERAHTYEKPGTYTATFTIRSGADCGQTDPKDSKAEVQLSITVA